MKTDTEEKAVKAKRLKHNDPLVLAEVAMLAITGAKASDIGAIMGLNAMQIGRVQRTPEYQKLFQDLVDRHLSSIIKRTRAQLAAMANTAVEVVKYHLEDNSLDAAKLVFKAMGLEQLETDHNDTHIQIVMPGAEAPKVVATEDLTVEI